VRVALALRVEEICPDLLDVGAHLRHRNFLRDAKHLSRAVVGITAQRGEPLNELSPVCEIS
jgi:hypothetical protein